MVVGDGTLLVPMWLRGLVQLLMAIIVRIISEQWVNGDDDNSEVLAKDKEHMKAIANRVPTGPSDCNSGMCVGPSTVGPKPNERRSKGRAAPKLCKRPQTHCPGPQGFVRCVGERSVKCQLVHEAEPLPMCAS